MRSETKNRQVMVSVIVPIYNVEKYLQVCLDSIERQTFQDIEVILVNDGSDDKSSQIAKQYVNKNKKFRLIEQQNRG